LASFEKRSTPATSATSFAAVSVPQPGSSRSGPGVAANQLPQLVFERLDVAGERLQPAQEIAADAHLSGLLGALEPAAQLLETSFAALEPLRLLVEGGIEVVQVPAQAVLDPGALGDEVLAVVDEQRDLACRASS
jgi:hypothetical protein